VAAVTSGGFPHPLTWRGRSSPRVLGRQTKGGAGGRTPGSDGGLPLPRIGPARLVFAGTRLWLTARIVVVWIRRGSFSQHVGPPRPRPIAFPVCGSTIGPCESTWSESRPSSASPFRTCRTYGQCRQMNITRRAFLSSKSERRTVRPVVTSGRSRPGGLSCGTEGSSCRSRIHRYPRSGPQGPTWRLRRRRRSARVRSVRGEPVSCGAGRYRGLPRSGVTTCPARGCSIGRMLPAGGACEGC